MLGGEKKSVKNNARTCLDLESVTECVSVYEVKKWMSKRELMKPKCFEADGFDSAC